jgi:hypothetical protein
LKYLVFFVLSPVSYFTLYAYSNYKDYRDYMIVHTTVGVQAFPGIHREVLPAAGDVEVPVYTKT